MLPRRTPAHTPRVRREPLDRGQGRRVRVEEAQTGRGERHSPATTDLPITMRLAEPPEPFDWLRTA